jgi:hypothetical protein
MLLTPTFVGLLLAGAAFWTLIWAAIHKLDEMSGNLPGVTNISAVSGSLTPSTTRFQPPSE